MLIFYLKVLKITDNMHLKNPPGFYMDDTALKYETYLFFIP